MKLQMNKHIAKDQATPSLHQMFTEIPIYHLNVTLLNLKI